MVVIIICLDPARLSRRLPRRSCVEIREFIKYFVSLTPVHRWPQLRGLVKRRCETYLMKSMIHGVACSNSEHQNGPVRSASS